MKEKVEFMEPIVLSLITRKAINHSIIKILKMYKNKIKVRKDELPNNDVKLHIAFIDSVNNISPNELNALFDKLFERKDEFNKDSHLVEKDLTTFFLNFWDKIVEHLKLNQNEITAFNVIINNDIGSNFRFDADDISVKDYLKSVYDNEFGKW